MDNSFGFAPGGPLAFERGEFDARLQRVRDSMDGFGVDVVVVTRPESIYYLTGYQTKGVFTFQAVVVTPNQAPQLLTRSTEDGNIRAALEGGSPLGAYRLYDDEQDPAETLVTLMDDMGVSRTARLGLETSSMGLPVPCYLALKNRQDRPDFDVDVTYPLEEQRLVKSAQEIALMERAGEIAVAAMTSAIGAVHEGARESEVAAAALSTEATSGGEYIGSWPNVVSGPRTKLSHQAWSERRVLAGEWILIELAGVVARYHAALERTVFVGEPTGLHREMVDVMHEANAAGRAALRAGNQLRDVYFAQYDLVKNAGLERFVHARLGYPLGIGFPPSWSPSPACSIVSNSEIVLEAGMAFHMLTSLGDAKVGGMGHSHTIVVTEGDPRVLTEDLVPTWSTP